MSVEGNRIKCYMLVTRIGVSELCKDGSMLKRTERCGNLELFCND